MKKRNNIYKGIRAATLIALLMLVAIGNLWAEGSKEIYPNGVSGSRSYLRASETESAAFPFPTLGTHFVYAKAGETIAIATDAQKTTAKRIFLFAPNGDDVTPTGTGTNDSGPNSTRGNIPSRIAELAGPRLPGQAAGENRYTPVYYKVPAEGEGIYKVEFRGGNDSRTDTKDDKGNDTSRYSATAIGQKADAWPALANKNYLVAWDISVANTDDGNAWIPGRVYTNVLNMDDPSYNSGSTGSFATNSGFHGKFKVLTRDGYVYNVNNNGMQGISFTFMVNNRGFHEVGNKNKPSYKSIDAPNAAAVKERYHDPRSLDAEAAVTHKIFYNLPDSYMPEKSLGGPEKNEMTWLRPLQQNLKVEDMEVFGADNIEGQISSKGGHIIFENNSGGDYTILISPDVDDTNFQPTMDFVPRVIKGESIIGINKIFFDGKAGTEGDLSKPGLILPQGNIPVRVTIQLQGAEVHFPYIDMELNKLGIIIELLDKDNNYLPAVDENGEKMDKVFWDDSNFTWNDPKGKGNASVPKNNSHLKQGNIGIHSNTNGHIWGTGSDATVGTFGDAKGMDTWSFITGDETTKPFSIIHRIADLSVEITNVKSENDNINIGDILTYTVVAANKKGSCPVEDTPFSFILPEGFIPVVEGENNITVKFSSGCGNESEAIKFDPITNTYNSKLNLGGNCDATGEDCTVTYTFNVQITDKSNPSNTEAVATIMRPNDVTDPDATNTSDPSKPKYTGNNYEEIDPNFYYPPTDPFFEVNNNDNDGESNNISKKTILFEIEYCVDGCNDNAFFNSTLHNNPNTLEYDNLVSTFHSSIAKEQDGVFKVWGEGSAADGSANLLSPTAIISSNGFNYTGTPLRATAGSKSISGRQFALLTTDGLYVWGTQGYLISLNLTSGTSFAKLTVNGKQDGLPDGVSPEEVKMMFGSYRTLAIVTCSGDAWVLSSNGSKNGDGTSQNSGTPNSNNVWHRVKINATTNLDNVVAMRGTPYALFALTAEGKLYTWGTDTYINKATGADSGATSRTYATEVSKPAGVTPKMIGMTQNGSNQTYYLLSTDGKLFAMGNNGQKQLGDGTTSASNTWKEVNSTQNISGTTYSLGGNVAWISPNEHDDYGQAAINVITNDKKQWAWGSNSGMMIGGARTNTNYDPMYMPGRSTDSKGLNIADNVIAIETGGHTTVNIKECSNNFGYVGHKTNGSMGDGTNGTGNPNTFSYSTAILVVCGTEVGTPNVQDLKVCENMVSANLDDAVINLTDIDIIEWRVADDKSSALVTNPHSVPPGTYYAFYKDGMTDFCENASTSVTVSYLVEGDPGYDDCATPIYAEDDINQTPMNTAVGGNVLTNDVGEGLTVTKVNGVDAGSDGKFTIQVSGKDNNGNHVPNAGTIVVNTDGSYIFTPYDGFVGTIDPIKYTATDEHGSSDEATLTIEVLPLHNPGKNNPPIARDDKITIEQQDTSVPGKGNLLGNDNDPDGDPITVTEIKVPASGGGTITVEVPTNGDPSTSTDVYDGTTKTGTITVDKDGDFTFIPEPNYVGEVPPIEYTISDGKGGTDNANLYITVVEDDGKNITVANDDANSAPKGETMTGNVLDNDFDPEGNNQTLTSVTIDGTDYPIIQGTPSEITITDKGKLIIGSDGKYTFVPEPEFVGTVVVEQNVCDNGTPEACDNATLYLTSLDKVNYWMGGTTDKENAWAEKDNWTAKYVPASGEDIEFATVENYGTAAVEDLHLDTDRIIGDLINNSAKDLVITQGNDLLVNGEVIDNNSDAGTIFIQAGNNVDTMSGVDAVATGTLRFEDSEKNKDVEATVQFYNKAYECGDCGYFKKSWQYFGIPVGESQFTYLSPEVETINEWMENVNGNKWVKRAATDKLQAFRGYEINNKSTTKPTHIYEFAGTLNVGDAKVDLTKTSAVNYSGMNLIANSYTAAIPISADAISYSGSNWDGNVYLFNAGTRDQWRKLNGGTVTHDTQSGQYKVVPLKLAGEAGLNDRIPSMHTFMVNAPSTGTMILAYDKLVKNELVDGLAWRSANAEKQEIPHIVMDVIGTQSADRVWLFEQSGTTRGFDNGWDGIKMPETDIVQLYVAGEEGADENYQVATVPQLIGTSFGMNPENNESYTLSMAVSQDVAARGLYLRDMLTGRSYALKNGAEYRVSGSMSSDSRFKIVDTMLDETKLGGNSLIDIYVQNNQVVVANNSDEDCTISLYDVAGKLVSKQTVARSSTTYINGRVGGAYVVKVVGTQNIQESKRVIVGRGQ